MSGCPSNQQLISYLAGNLPDTDSVYVEEHAESCAACRQSLSRLTEPIDLPRLNPVRAAEPLTSRLYELARLRRVAWRTPSAWAHQAAI